ncbi:putative phage tail protein [Paenibacillus sp. GCM10027627]|uniref:putative phage tail protein n=1 Tax=unclassified Paenibacillus TaxID=185978 RepID=UPI00362518DA
MLNYWPDYLHDIREFRAIAEAEQPEIDGLTDGVNAMSRNFSVFTLDEVGIKRWENILGIAGKAADHMDSRRFRIISRIIDQIPITKRTLFAQLETLCGKGGFTLQVDSETYTVSIKLALTSKYAFDDVVALVKRSLPANLVYRISIMYNQHGKLSNRTHGQLALKTHNDLKNEVI